MDVAPEDRRRFCLSDPEVAELARYAVVIEEHYSREAGKPRPMDVEWAKDGITGQARFVSLHLCSCRVPVVPS